MINISSGFHNPPHKRRDFFLRRNRKLIFLISCLRKGQSVGNICGSQPYSGFGTKPGAQRLQSSVGKELSAGKQAVAGTDFLRVAELVGAEENCDSLFPGQRANHCVDTPGAFRVKP